jgi:hypothetical protein
MEALIFAIMAGTLGPLEANSKPAFVFLYGVSIAIICCPGRVLLSC